MKSYYELLSVERNADVETVHRAYRKLARKYHPDVNPDPKSHETMSRINEAFKALSDPQRRMEYDAMLNAGLADSPAPKQEKPRVPLIVRLHQRLRAHKTPVYSLAFVPDTGELISGSFDNEVFWWNPVNGATTRRLKVESGAISALRAVSAANVIAAGTSENSISVCRINTKGAGSWKNTLSEWGACVAISPDGKRIATGTVYHALIVTDAIRGDVLFERKDHNGSISAVAWSADGRFIATGSSDNSVRLRNADDGKVLHTFSAIRTTVTALAFSPDNHYLVVASADLSLRVFSLSDGSLERVLFGHTKPIESISFHPNGWLFATGARDGSVGLWNASDGLGQLKLEASSRPILSVAFSSDGNMLAAGGLDKNVRLWTLMVNEEALGKDPRTKKKPASREKYAAAV
ncbi:MAG: DnaJ domain-containing protein [Fimbriimonadaceae bacterium]|nr:DnaJ domain-containing protein [Fimbriimonadaceae bacterium]